MFLDPPHLGAMSMLQLLPDHLIGELKYSWVKPYHSIQCCHLAAKCIIINIFIQVAGEILQQNGRGPAREFGNLGNFGFRKIPKMKLLKIKIRHAQNVGKVQISRKKQFPAPFGTI